MNFNFQIVQTQLCEINKAKQCLSLPGTEHLGSCLSLQSVVLLILIATASQSSDQFCSVR